MSLKEVVVGGVLTLVVGGTAYTINQEDVVTNFAEDTGVSQQEAEQYVNSVEEEDLVEWDVLGNDYISAGQEIVNQVSSIDCINYSYEWQSPSITCEQGKQQLNRYGNDAISLGQAYKALGADNASKVHMSSAVRAIDTLNADYALPVVMKIIDPSTISEDTKANSYNKSLLKAVLESQ